MSLLETNPQLPNDLIDRQPAWDGDLVSCHDRPRILWGDSTTAATLV